MPPYTSQNLIIHPSSFTDTSLVVEVTPEKAGWNTIHFQARRLPVGGQWSFDTDDNELAIVILGGTLDVQSTRGQWASIGKRANVFAGLPYALYLPRRTAFTVTAATSSEFAVAWVAASGEYAPKLILPSDMEVEIRGGENATRQINRLLPPGFACDRLVVVEVYTPGGNWSSYPPHKHDLHTTDAQGQLLEADLDEIYYYKFDRPEGYAFQRIYTDPGSPLHRAGFPIDAVALAQNDDVVLIPEGYHPVASPPGYTTYYLNVLAGSAQSLAATDDPRYAWVKQTYRAPDPRVPVYEVRSH